MRKIITTLLLFITTLAAACTGTREQTETVVTPQPSATQAAPAQASPSAQTSATATPAPVAAAASPPSPAEVKDKVAHIFQGAAQFAESQTGGTVVGDFNGDGSEDIAVVIRPDPTRLEDFNSEVSLWILNDPHKVVVPDLTKAVEHPPVL